MKHGVNRIFRAVFADDSPSFDFVFIPTKPPYPRVENESRIEVLAGVQSVPSAVIYGDRVNFMNILSCNYE